MLLDRRTCAAVPIEKGLLRLPSSKASIVVRCGFRRFGVIEREGILFGPPWGFRARAASAAEYA